MTDLIITATVIYMAIFIIAVYFSFKELASKKYIKQSAGAQLIHEASQETRWEPKLNKVPIYQVLGTVQDEQACSTKKGKQMSDDWQTT